MTLSTFVFLNRTTHSSFVDTSLAFMAFQLVPQFNTDFLLTDIVELTPTLLTTLSLICVSLSLELKKQHHCHLFPPRSPLHIRQIMTTFRELVVGRGGSFPDSTINLKDS